MGEQCLKIQAKEQNNVLEKETGHKIKREKISRGSSGTDSY